MRQLSVSFAHAFPAAARICRFPYQPRQVTGRGATKEDSDEREWSRSLGCRRHRPGRTFGLVHPQGAVRAKPLEDASPDGGRVALRSVPPFDDRLDARAPRRGQRSPRQTCLPARRICRVLIGVPRGEIPSGMSWVSDRTRGLAPSRARAETPWTDDLARAHWITRSTEAHDPPFPRRAIKVRETFSGERMDRERRGEGPNPKPSLSLASSCG